MQEEIPGGLPEDEGETRYIYLLGTPTSGSKPTFPFEKNVLKY